jgi:hypothetical protein
MSKLLVLLVLFSVCAQAKTTKFKTLDFNTIALGRSDAHYSFKLINKSKIKELPASFKELYAIGMKGVKGTKIVISKNVILVNKPVSFFTKEKVLDPRFNKKSISAHKVFLKESGSSALRVENTGMFSYDYDLYIYFKDASVTDLAAGQNAYVSKMYAEDAYVGNADAQVLRLSRNFSDLGYGSAVYSNYIAYGDQTIISSYSIVALKSIYAWGSIVESNLVKEITKLRDKTNAL